MKKNTVVGLKKPFETAEDPLTKLLRTGAKRLIAEAVEAELQDFLEQFSKCRNQQGHRQVVRNGNLPERVLLTGIGPVTVKVPKVRDKSGQGIKFNSALLPPYLRKAKAVDDLLPWLYLKGISSGDFQEALRCLLGPNALEVRLKQLTGAHFLPRNYHKNHFVCKNHMFWLLMRVIGGRRQVLFFHAVDLGTVTGLQSCCL